MNINIQNIREAIALLSPDKKSVSAPPPPPAPSHIQNLIQNSHEARTGISVLVSMTYQSLSGNLRSRDILIRRIIQTKGDYYIDGVAMDKYAPRLIKCSHIKGIRDITSGRVYRNPYDFIQNRLGIKISLPPQQQEAIPSPDIFAQVIERTGHEMVVLMYLVAIDGERNKAEREKVFQYVKSRTKDLTYPDSELNDYLVSLAPDEESCSAALGLVLKKEEAVVQGFVEAILDVIMADGRVNPRERAFLIRMMDLLEADGYNISLPI